MQKEKCRNLALNGPAEMSGLLSLTGAKRTSTKPEINKLDR